MQPCICCRRAFRDTNPSNFICFTICVDAWLQPQHLHCISAMLFPCPRDVALCFSVLLHFRLRLIHRHGEVLIKYRQFYILLQDLSLIILCVLTTPTLAVSTPTPPARGNSTNITTPIINPTNTTFFDVVPVSLSHTLPRWTSVGWRRYFFLHRCLYYGNANSPRMPSDLSLALPHSRKSQQLSAYYGHFPSLLTFLFISIGAGATAHLFVL